ncbi:serine/threonine protein kinase, partial [bacterium]|nr:serine/threonine protein kinase [bacterium]
MTPEEDEPSGPADGAPPPASGASQADLDRTVVGVEPVDPTLGAKFSGCVVERKLGQGGMGSVYLARRESDSQQVVVKFLAPEQAQNATWRARFLREAKMMHQISHPNIVAVFSIDGESSQPHIVMEFVDGRGLEIALRAGPLPPLEGARIARDAALGLSEAHKSGIIHRDIKPANVLLTQEGEVKVLDFGLAKSVEFDDGLSLPGQVLGTPHYMAPEQWGDHQVDARCDVFSLGATLYHLITGSPPFPGASPQAISRKTLEGSFVPPRTLAPDIPVDLELVIYRMMASDRRFRYGCAEDCAKALDRVIRGEEVEVPRIIERAGSKRH